MNCVWASRLLVPWRLFQAVHFWKSKELVSVGLAIRKRKKNWKFSLGVEREENEYPKRTIVWLILYYAPVLLSPTLNCLYRPYSWSATDIGGSLLIPLMSAAAVWSSFTHTHTHKQKQLKIERNVRYCAAKFKCMKNAHLPAWRLHLLREIWKTSNE